MSHQPNVTADELRNMAKACRQESINSFDRCDTDGFLSQGCSDLMARLYETQAWLLEQGGTSEFSALFDLCGNLVAAKTVETIYGTKWGILENDDPSSRIVKFVAYKPKRKSTLEKHGYREGRVKAPAYADLRGSHIASVRPCILRDDRGFSRNVEVVDNGC